MPVTCRGGTISSKISGSFWGAWRNPCIYSNLVYRERNHDFAVMGRVSVTLIYQSTHAFSMLVVGRRRRAGELNELQRRPGSVRIFCWIDDLKALLGSDPSPTSRTRVSCVIRHIFEYMCISPAVAICDLH